jgi:hypothetical protein
LTPITAVCLATVVLLATGDSHRAEEFDTAAGTFTLAVGA